MQLHWKERYGKDGICDFKANYDFYYKWLLSKTASCFYFKNLPDTLDEYYIKSCLLVDGDICITDFNGDIYACIGAPGGKPDAYYKPTVYTVANPILGSKVVEDGVSGIILYNTPTDAYISGGLNGLLAQTATLLADNIISINCCQINSRVAALVSADSKSQALEAENVMKSIYAGHPYKVIPADLIEKINVNPISTSNVSQTISELVELHNYIISNYFQAIGIKANDIRKKSHVLQDEIDVQNDYLQISILEILTSWQAGFDKVNAMYGTDIRVELNPALLDVVYNNTTEQNDIVSDESDVQDNKSETQDNNDDNVSDVQDVPVVDELDDLDEPKESNDIIDDIVETTAVVEDIVDLINDEGGESDESESPESESMGDSDSTRREQSDS